MADRLADSPLPPPPIPPPLPLALPPPAAAAAAARSKVWWAGGEGRMMEGLAEGGEVEELVGDREACCIRMGCGRLSSDVPPGAELTGMRWQRETHERG